ncbi:hypothetical protein AB0G15_34945, partial [Streptosporangium sp. NPDC023825]
MAARLLKRGLLGVHADLQRQLLKMTGGWPLLLALVNARLVEDVSRGAEVNAAAKQAVNRLRQEGPAALDITDSGQRETAVKATIDYSLEALATDKRGRFLELGIFAEDTDVPLDMVTMLWRERAKFTFEQSQALCEELAGLSLMSMRWIDGQRQVVSLHDVVRSFARSDYSTGVRRQVEADRSLIKQARYLVSYIGENGDNSAWWQLPKEHFLWDHLVYHLVGGEHQSEADRLVTDIRWIMARLDLSGPLAVEADLAWSSASQVAEIRRLIARIGHLLGETESKELSKWNRLAYLSILPCLRNQIELIYGRDNPLLLSIPESHDLALTYTLATHIGLVSAVAISSDGTWLASASHDGTVRIWNTDGSQRHILSGHTDWVSAVAIAPDGTWLASASDDGTIRIWNIDGSERAVLSGHTKSVKTVAIAPDGTWLASASRDRTIRIWNIDGSQRAVLSGHTGSVRTVAIAPDGTWLASASHDGTVRIWNTDGSQRRVLSGHTDWVIAVVIAPDGTWLASASDDGTIRIWDTAGSQRTVLSGHTSSVWAVAIAPDGTWLASASTDETARIWNADGSQRAVLSGHTQSVWAVVIAPDGTWLASASDDGTIRIWDTDGSQRAVLSSHTGPVWAVATAPDGTWLASATDNGTVRVWDTDGSQRRILSGHTDWVSAVAIAPDGTWLASASRDGTARIWDTDGSQRHILSGHTDWVSAVAIAPDGRWLASASDDGTIRT